MFRSYKIQFLYEIIILDMLQHSFVKMKALKSDFNVAGNFRLILLLLYEMGDLSE
jgi:hypothetical protein